MMFRLPSTAGTSEIKCPSMRCGKTAKWMNDGGRVRARHGRPVLLEIAIDYSRKTYFTKGVVLTNLWRLPWRDWV